MPRRYQLPDGRWLRLPDDPEQFSLLSGAIGRIYGIGLPDPQTGRVSPVAQQPVPGGNIIGSAWEAVKQVPFGLMDVPLSMAQSAVGVLTPGSDLPIEEWFRDVQESGRARIDPKYADAFLPKVGHGLGQVGGMIAGNFLSAGVGYGAMLSLGISDQIRRMARQEQLTGKPVPGLNQTAAHVFGAGVGLTERFGLKGIVGTKVPASLGQVSRRFFADTVKGRENAQMIQKAATSVGREALQEGAQQFLSATVARGFYDPDAFDDILEAMAEDASVGGVVGGLASVMLDGFLGIRRRSGGMGGISGIVENTIRKGQANADAAAIAEGGSADRFVIRDLSNVLKSMVGDDAYLSDKLAKFGGFELEDYSEESIQRAIEQQGQLAELALTELDIKDSYEPGTLGVSRETIQQQILDVTERNVAALSRALRTKTTMALLPFPETLELKGEALDIQQRLELIKSLADDAFIFDDAIGGDIREIRKINAGDSDVSNNSIIDILTTDRMGGPLGLGALHEFIFKTGAEADLGLEKAAEERGMTYIPEANSNNNKVTPADAAHTVFHSTVLEGQPLVQGEETVVEPEVEVVSEVQAVNEGFGIPIDHPLAGYASKRGEGFIVIQHIDEHGNSSWRIELQPENKAWLDEDGNRLIRKDFDSDAEYQYFLDMTTEWDVANEKARKTLAKVWAEMQQQQAPPTPGEPSVPISEFRMVSGGAVGSDFQWDDIGKKFGLNKIFHFFVNTGKNNEKENWFGNPKYANLPISQEKAREADEKLEKANRFVRRVFPIMPRPKGTWGPKDKGRTQASATYANNLLRRNWYQVREADTIFAVSSLDNSKPGLAALGGTGWAVQMAIDEGKPVYLFDQESKGWFTGDNASRKEVDTPTLTPKFAGIGTREITPAGKKAIEDVYSKTAGRPAAPVKWHTMAMNFKDGDKGYRMRPEFKGLSTMDLVISGERTSTTRSANYKKDNPVKIGDFVNFTDRDGRSVRVQATSNWEKLGDQPKGKKVAEEWSLAEGWAPSVYKKLRGTGHWQFRYQLPPTPEAAPLEGAPAPVPTYTNIGQLPPGLWTRYVQQMPVVPGLTLLVDGGRDFGQRADPEQSEDEKRQLKQAVKNFIDMYGKPEAVLILRDDQGRGSSNAAVMMTGIADNLNIETVRDIEVSTLNRDHQTTINEAESNYKFLLERLDDILRSKITKEEDLNKFKESWSFLKRFRRQFKWGEPTTGADVEDYQYDKPIWLQDLKRTGDLRSHIDYPRNKKLKERLLSLERKSKLYDIGKVDPATGEIEMVEVKVKGRAARPDYRGDATWPETRTFNRPVTEKVSLKGLVYRIRRAAEAYDQAQSDRINEYRVRNKNILTPEFWAASKYERPRAVLLMGYEGAYEHRGRGKKELKPSIRTRQLAQSFLSSAGVARLETLKRDIFRLRRPRRRDTTTGNFTEDLNKYRENLEKAEEFEKEVAELEKSLDEVQPTSGYLWPERLAAARKLKSDEQTVAIVPREQRNTAGPRTRRIEATRARAPRRVRPAIPDDVAVKEFIPETPEGEPLAWNEGTQSYEFIEEDLPVEEETAVPDIPDEIIVQREMPEHTRTVVEKIRRLRDTIDNAKQADSYERKEGESDGDYRRRLNALANTIGPTSQAIRVAQFDLNSQLIKLSRIQLDNLISYFNGGPGFTAHPEKMVSAAVRLGFMTKEQAKTGKTSKGLGLFDRWLRDVKSRVDGASEVYTNFDDTVVKLVNAQIEEQLQENPDLDTASLRIDLELSETEKMKLEIEGADRVRASVLTPSDIIKLGKLFHASPYNDMNSGKLASASTDATFYSMAIGNIMLWMDKHGLDSSMSLAESKTVRVLDEFLDAQGINLRGKKDDLDIEDYYILELLEAKNISLRTEKLLGRLIRNVGFGFESTPFVSMLRDFTGAESWATATETQKFLMYSKLLSLPAYERGANVYLPDLYRGAEIMPYKEAIINFLTDSPSLDHSEVMESIEESMEDVDFDEELFNNAFAQLMESDMIHESFAFSKQEIGKKLFQRVKDGQEMEFVLSDAYAQYPEDSGHEYSRLRSESLLLRGIVDDGEGGGTQMSEVEWTRQIELAKEKAIKHLDTLLERQEEGLPDEPEFPDREVLQFGGKGADKDARALFSITGKMKGIIYEDDLVGDVELYTVEHAILAGRTSDPDLRRQVYATEGIQAARKVMRNIPIPDGWIENRDILMKQVLTQKFTQEPYRTQLKSEPAVLVDNRNNHWSREVPRLIEEVRMELFGEGGSQELVPSNRGLVPSPTLVLFGGPLTDKMWLAPDYLDPEAVRHDLRDGRGELIWVKKQEKDRRRAWLEGRRSKGRGMTEAQRRASGFRYMAMENAVSAWRNSEARIDRIRDMIRDFVRVRGMPELVRMPGTVHPKTGIPKKGDISEAWTRVLDEFGIPWEIVSIQWQDTKGMKKDQAKEARKQAVKDRDIELAQWSSTTEFLREEYILDPMVDFNLPRMRGMDPWYMGIRGTSLRTRHRRLSDLIKNLGFPHFAYDDYRLLDKTMKMLEQKALDADPLGMAFFAPDPAPGAGDEAWDKMVGSAKKWSDQDLASEKERKAAADRHIEYTPAMARALDRAQEEAGGIQSRASVSGQEFDEEAVEAGYYEDIEGQMRGERGTQIIDPETEEIILYPYWAEIKESIENIYSDPEPIATSYQRRGVFEGPSGEDGPMAARRTRQLTSSETTEAIDRRFKEEGIERIYIGKPVHIKGEHDPFVFLHQSLDKLIDDIYTPAMLRSETAEALEAFDTRMRKDIVRARVEADKPLRGKIEVKLNPQLPQRGIPEISEAYVVHRGERLIQELSRDEESLSKFDELRGHVSKHVGRAMTDMEFAGIYHDALIDIDWAEMDETSLRLMAAWLSGRNPKEGVPTRRSLERGVLSVSREATRGKKPIAKRSTVLLPGDPGNTTGKLRSLKTEIDSRFRYASDIARGIWQELGIEADVEAEFVDSIDSLWQFARGVSIRGDFYPGDVPAIYDRLGSRIIINLAKVDPNNRKDIEESMKLAAFHEGVTHLYFTDRMTSEEKEVLENAARTMVVDRSIDSRANERQLTYFARRALDPRYENVSAESLVMESSIDLLYGMTSGKVEVPGKSPGTVGGIKNNFRKLLDGFLIPAKEADLQPVVEVLDRLMQGTMGARDPGYSIGPAGPEVGEARSPLFTRFADPEQVKKLEQAVALRESAKTDSERNYYQKEVDQIVDKVTEMRESVMDSLPPMPDEFQQMQNESQATQINDDNPWYDVPTINKLNMTTFGETEEEKKAYRIALDEYLKMRNNPSYGGYQMPGDFAALANKQTNIPTHLIELIQEFKKDNIIEDAQGDPFRGRIKAMAEWADGESMPQTLSSTLDFSGKFRENYLDSHYRAAKVEEAVNKLDNRAYAEADSSMLLALRWSSNTLNMMPGLLVDGPISYIGMSAQEGMYENRPLYDKDLVSEENPDGRIPGLQKVFNRLQHKPEMEGAHLYGIATRIKESMERVRELKFGIERTPDGPVKEILQGRLQTEMDEYEVLNPIEKTGKRKGERFFPEDRIESTIAEFGEIEEVVKYWKEIDSINRAMLNFSRNTDLVSDGVHDKWVGRRHTPFYKDVGEVEASPFGTAWGITQKGSNKIEKALSGSLEPIRGDMFLNIEQGYKAMIRDGTQNVALLRLVRDLMKAPVPEIRRLTSAQVMLANQERVVRVMRKGEVEFYELADPELAKSVMTSGVNARQQLEQMFGGEKMGEGLSKLFMGAPQVIREAVTRMPPYMGRNVMRDSMQADVSLGAGPPVIFEALKNVFNSGSLERARKLHLAIGLDTISSGYAEEVWLKRYKTDLKNINWLNPLNVFAAVWHGLGRMASQSEVAVRLAIYDRVLAATGNKALAQGLALEFLNFGRRGASPMFRVWLGTVPFMNGRIQGFDMLWRSGVSNTMDAPDLAVLSMPPEEQMAAMAEGKPSRVWRRRRRLLYARGAQLSMLSMLYWLLIHDDEEYRSQRPEVRADNWLFPFSKKLWLKLPTPFEVGVLFKIIPEQLAELIAHDDVGLAEASTQIQRQIRNSFSIGPPQLIAPIYDAIRNHDSYRGDYIVDPLTNQTIEPIEQRNMYTSNTAIGFAQLADSIPLVRNAAWLTSPQKVSYMMRQFGGTFGAYMVLVSDRIARSGILPYSEAQNVVGTMYDFDWNSLIGGEGLDNWPLFGDVLLDPREGSANTQSLYDMLRRLDQVSATETRISERDWREGLKYQQENLMYKLFGGEVLALQRALENTNESKEFIMRSRNLSKEEKRSRLRRITEMQQRMTRRVESLQVILRNKTGRRRRTVGA